jgi:hypothetical protein
MQLLLVPREKFVFSRLLPALYGCGADGEDKKMKVMAENNRTSEKIVRLMQTDKSEDAPAASIKWAKNLFLTRAARPTLVQKIMAVMQLDLSPGKAAFGERSASGAGARQMLFRGGDATIDLRITKTDGTHSLRGQILGGDFAHCPVALGTLETETNEGSEFKFDDVPAGLHNFILRGRETEIAIENLEIT